MVCQLFQTLHIHFTLTQDNIISSSCTNKSSVNQSECYIKYKWGNIQIRGRKRVRNLEKTLIQSTIETLHLALRKGLNVGMQGQEHRENMWLCMSISLLKLYSVQNVAYLFICYYWNLHLALKCTRSSIMWFTFPKID